MPPHHHEKQNSSKQGSREHQRKWNQKGNQYGGTWKTKSNAWRYKSSAMKTWNQSSNQDEYGDGMEAVGSHVHISLGWMDAHAWCQLTTLLNKSYCMASSRVLRTKHEKGGGM